jgi:hypothetical protein
VPASNDSRLLPRQFGPIQRTTCASPSMLRRKVNRLLTPLRRAVRQVMRRSPRPSITTHLCHETAGSSLPRCLQKAGSPCNAEITNALPGSLWRGPSDEALRACNQRLSKALYHWGPLARPCNTTLAAGPSTPRSGNAVTAMVGPFDPLEIGCSTSLAPCPRNPTLSNRHC